MSNLILLAPNPLFGYLLENGQFARAHQRSMAPDEKHILRITLSGTIKAFVGYGDRVLSDPNLGHVRIVAFGKAIGKGITVAEILKRKHGTLHQMTTLTSESNDKGSSNPVSCLSVTLSVSPHHVDSKHPSYVLSRVEHSETS